MNLLVATVPLLSLQTNNYARNIILSMQLCVDIILLALHCKNVVYYMTLWSVNRPTIRVINTPTVLYITPISVVCTWFLQCTSNSYSTCTAVLPKSLQAAALHCCHDNPSDHLGYKKTTQITIRSLYVVTCDSNG